LVGDDDDDDDMDCIPRPGKWSDALFGRVRRDGLYASQADNDSTSQHTFRAKKFRPIGHSSAVKWGMPWHVVSVRNSDHMWNTVGSPSSSAAGAGAGAGAFACPFASSTAAAAAVSDDAVSRMLTTKGL